MNNDEEIQNQQNKGHKKMNDKLKKKRNKEKESKKMKKLQKQAYELIKDDKRTQFFQQRNKDRLDSGRDQYGININKLNKALKKFLITYNDELEDFLNIFQQLDQGSEIETTEIEDKKIRKRLEKIFKILKLRKVQVNDNNKFIKQKITDKLELFQYIKNKVNEIYDSLNVSSQSQVSGSSVSRSLSSNQNSIISNSRSRSRSNSLKLAKNKIVKKQEEVAEKPIISVKKGPYIPPEFDRKLVEAKLKQNIPVKESELGDEGKMDEFLQGVFGGTQKRDLSKFLDQRITKSKEVVEKSIKNESNKIEYLGGKLDQEDLSQDQLQKYMHEWDSENRGKSLMQIHKEKLRMEKIEKLKTQGQAFLRKDFNRDTDLEYFKTDSKKVMQSMRQGDGSLVDKFSRGNIQNSFI